MAAETKRFLEYLTLCLPAFVSTIEKTDSGRMDVARAAVRTRSPRKDHQRDRARAEDPELFGGFPWTSGCEEYRPIAMDPIIALAVQLGGDFVVFISTIQQVCVCSLTGFFQRNTRCSIGTNSNSSKSPRLNKDIIQSCCIRVFRVCVHMFRRCIYPPPTYTKCQGWNNLDTHYISPIS